MNYPGQLSPGKAGGLPLKPENIMRLRLDMLNNRRRLRIATAAAILVACAGTQAARNGGRPAAGIPTELRPFADDL